MLKEAFKNYYLQLLVISGLTVLYIQFPLLRDEYTVGCDTRTDLWFFSQAEAYETEITTINEQFVKTKLARCLGYYGMYKLVSQFVSPLTFNKHVPFILVFLSLLYLYKIGSHIKNNRVGFIFAVLCLLIFSSFYVDIYSGLHRAFGVFLVIASLHYTLKKRFLGIFCCIILECLFYPPSLLVSFPTWALSILRYEFSSKRIIWIDKKELIQVSITILICFLLILPTISWVKKLEATFLMPDQTTEVVVEKMPLRENPRFNEGGVVPIFMFDGRIFNFIPMYFLVGHGGIVTNAVRHLIPFGFFFSLTIISILLVKRPFEIIPREIWLFFISGIALYVLAWIAAFMFDKFVLYYPSRYIRFTIYISIALILSLNIAKLSSVMESWHKSVYYLLTFIAIMGVIASWFFSPDFVAEHFSSDHILESYTIHQVKQVRIILFLSSCSAILISIIVWSKKIRKKSNLEFLILALICFIFIPLFDVGSGSITLTPDEKALSSFLSGLPESTIVAGHPDAMNNLALFSSVNILCHSQGIQDAEDPVINQLVFDLFSAYYATQPEILEEFKKKYNVDLFIVEKKHFTGSYLKRGVFYPEPYNEVIKREISDQSEFLFQKVSQNKIIYENHTYSVLKY